MTAPDPGLTDLIAAHTLRVVELNEAARYPECNGCDWVGGLVKDHAVHLASVVEQHTNGRIAELEDGIMRAIHELIETRERAEKAEAELEKHRAEERRELESARNRARDDVRCPSCNLRYGERDQYGCIEPARAHDYDADELRAALEGVGDADPT